MLEISLFYSQMSCVRWYSGRNAVRIAKFSCTVDDLPVIWVSSVAILHTRAFSGTLSHSWRENNENYRQQ